MKIGIIGTGAYAIALTSIISENVNDIIMWTKLENEYIELINNYTNKKALNIKLKENIKFTMNLQDVIQNKDLIIIAIPSEFILSTVIEMTKYYQNSHILIATKGIEPNTKCLIHELLIQHLKTKNIACISGPSFATDVIKKEAIGLTVASLNNETEKIIKNIFNNINYIDIDYSKDIIGCEICGAIKNIMSIGMGILSGMNLTPSCQAKFITKISLEIKKIILLFNGEEKTFFSYCGIGDLLLSFISTNSRNYKFGYLIGNSKDYKEYQNNYTIEGITTLKTLKLILDELNQKSQIIDIIYDIVYNYQKKELIYNYLNLK